MGRPYPPGNNTLAPLAQCEQGRESIEGTHTSMLVVKNFCHKLFPGSPPLSPNYTKSCRYQEQSAQVEESEVLSNHTTDYWWVKHMFRTKVLISADSNEWLSTKKE